MRMACVCEEIAGKGYELSSICIGHHWVCANLTDKERESLAKSALRREFKKGEVVFNQGDIADKMFLIKAGRVKLSKFTENGHELTLDIRKAGDFLGENTLNDSFPYPVTASCIEKSLTCGFSRPSFAKLVLENPNIGLQVIKNLSQRIEWMTARSGSMALTNLEDRLYKVLINVAKEHGVRQADNMVIQFPITHEELSFLVGVHRVTITRAMKALKQEGKVLQKRKTLILTHQLS